MLKHLYARCRVLFTLVSQNIFTKSAKSNQTVKPKVSTVSSTEMYIFS